MAFSYSSLSPLPQAKSSDLSSVQQVLTNKHKTKSHLITRDSLIIKCTSSSSLSISSTTLQKSNNTHNHNQSENRINKPIFDTCNHEIIRPLFEIHNNDQDHNHNQNQNHVTRPLFENWQEIQGSKNWEGLLDPLDPNLRLEILRYGEFAQACYDAFDFETHACKHSRAHLFDGLGLIKAGYVATRYLYATSNDAINYLPNFFRHGPRANWMGYVAVSDDDTSRRLGRRDVVVAWRGTVTYLEWLWDLKDILEPAGFVPYLPSIKVESGFLHLYTNKDHTCRYCSFSAREQVLDEVKRLREYYLEEKGEEISITITGHSLGSALAILSAYDIAEQRLNLAAPVTVFSFGGPRVGNLKFKERCDDLGVKVLRIVNSRDVVPTVPGIIANENVRFQKYIEDAISFPWSYAHVGPALLLDHFHSPYLKPTRDPSSAHNLEVHLHLVDGFHAKGEGFRSATNRDIALVNKNCDILRPHYGVPPNWRFVDLDGTDRLGLGHDQYKVFVKFS